MKQVTSASRMTDRAIYGGVHGGSVRGNRSIAMMAFVQLEDLLECMFHTRRTIFPARFMKHYMYFSCFSRSTIVTCKLH